MNTVDRVALIELVEHQQTTRLAIDTYLSAIAIAKLDKETEYPTIYSFTPYKLYKSMKDNMDWINESSVYFALDRLIEMGLVHHDKVKKELWILNSGTGHIEGDKYRKNKGYIKLHHFFFERIFYYLPLVEKKIALLAALRLNGDALDPENINFKSKKNPETFEYYKRVLKVNRLAHIKTAIRHLKEVGLFTISELENNTVQFALNTISKALVVGTDKLFSFTQDQLTKTTKMLKEANKGVVSFQEQHIKAVCEVIKDFSMEFGRKVCRELCKNNRGNIRNILGYTKGIVARLQHSPA